MSEIQDRDEEIISEIVSGKSFSSLGRAYQLSPERIRQIAEKRGVKSQHVRPRLEPERVAAAVSLYERGMPITHIAETLETTFTTVSRHLMLQGIYTPEQRDCVAWDKTKDDLLRKHYNAFPGAVRMLADKLGTTRNSIVGRANRLGLHKRKEAPAC